MIYWKWKSGISRLKKATVIFIDNYRITVMAAERVEREFIEIRSSWDFNYNTKGFLKMEKGKTRSSWKTKSMF